MRKSNEAEKNLNWSTYYILYTVLILLLSFFLQSREWNKFRIFNSNNSFKHFFYCFAFSLFGSKQYLYAYITINIDLVVSHLLIVNFYNCGASDKTIETVLFLVLQHFRRTKYWLGKKQSISGILVKNKDKNSVRYQTDAQDWMPRCSNLKSKIVAKMWKNKNKNIEHRCFLWIDQNKRSPRETEIEKKKKLSDHRFENNNNNKKKIEDIEIQSNFSALSLFYRSLDHNILEHKIKC